MPSSTVSVPCCVLEERAIRCHISRLTLRPGLGGEGRRAGDVAVVGQDAEDGRLQRCQDEENLQAQQPRGEDTVPTRSWTWVSATAGSCPTSSPRCEWLLVLGLTWKQVNLAWMFCSIRCVRACRNRMPRAHSPKRVEAPTTVLIQSATLSAEIWGEAGNASGLPEPPPVTLPGPTLQHSHQRGCSSRQQTAPAPETRRPSSRRRTGKSPASATAACSWHGERGRWHPEVSMPGVFSSAPALPHLLMVIRGRQGQQQQQGPVLSTMGTSFRVLSTASLPPKPSTMTSIRR